MPYHKSKQLLTTAIAVFMFLISVAVHAQGPVSPIPMQSDAQPVPAFIGNPAEPSPISALAIPQNPFLAGNGMSNMHGNSYMSDTYIIPGTLGKTPQINSNYLGATCVSMAFDQQGRIITLCLNLKTATLYLLDPVSLATQATLDLPAKAVKSMTEFPAGSYFYLDHQDRALIPTIERTVWKVAVIESTSGPRFEREHIYDLANTIPESDSIGSVLPDFSGRLWFVSKGGMVGTLNPQTESVSSLQLDGEAITNSFALDETGGVFIASDHAMYRFDVDSEGSPVMTWREVYDRGSKRKPGQVAQGTGTTPTLMGKEFVTITDNADPQMHVLVYRRDPVVKDARLVCSEAVFAADQSATENSLIATDHSIIVENNYGYSGPLATTTGYTTQPGITRIDLDSDGKCHTLWTSIERVPNVVSKLSLATGLIYTYTKDEGPSTTDAWYFSAVDFISGKTVFKQLAGTGIAYNSHYAGLYLGSSGAIYVGVIGGIVAMRDQL
jgi:hypothetical protein